MTTLLAADSDADVDWFPVGTIATCVLWVYSALASGRQIGRLQCYGEVLSGAFIFLVGIAVWIWPVL